MKPTPRAPYVVLRLSATLIVATLSISFCAFANGAARAQKIGDAGVAGTEGTSSMASENNDENAGIAGLPFARGAVFRCLDDYLAHLEQQSAMDLPSWREIRPGVYERVTNVRGREREVATRAELMQRFGFSC